jgi:hypothetical protein
MQFNYKNKINQKDKKSKMNEDKVQDKFNYINNNNDKIFIQINNQVKKEEDN